MKTLLLLVVVGVCGLQRREHLILDDNWTGNKCSDACEAKGGVVCGKFSKECCSRCSGFPTYTCAGDKYRQLDCSFKKQEQGFLAKLTDNSTWTGSSCNDACEAKQGQVCGTLFSECCAVRCEKTALVYQSCFKGEKVSALDCSYRKPDSAVSVFTGGIKGLLCFWCD